MGVYHWIHIAITFHLIYNTPILFQMFKRDLNQKENSKPVHHFFKMMQYRIQKAEAMHPQISIDLTTFFIAYRFETKVKPTFNHSLINMSHSLVISRK